jgi:uncharacterized protein YprB with RNaseH-like and TPR domain
MIESSFCFLPGVGPRTERRFWHEGLWTWERFLIAHNVPGIGPARKARFDHDVREAQQRFAHGDSRYFAAILPSRYQWRLYEWLRAQAVYLDIETNSFGEITVVGLYGHGTYTALIRGETLDWRQLADELCQYELLVTFCGTSFDLPMLMAHFPNLPLNQPHIDLCGVGRQLGYRGGLKAIERRMGIERASELQGFTGADAVRQWNRWRHRRDDEARRLLVAYNEADCVNLEHLADEFYCQLVQSTVLHETKTGSGVEGRVRSLGHSPPD